MRSFGAPEEEIEAAVEKLQSREKPQFEVWDDNWQAWELFSRCRQWRTNPMDGRILGLDWAVVLGVLEMFVARRKRRAELYDDLRYIEHGALDVFSKKAE